MKNVNEHDTTEHQLREDWIEMDRERTREIARGDRNIIIGVIIAAIFALGLLSVHLSK